MKMNLAHFLSGLAFTAIALSGCKKDVTLPPEDDGIPFEIQFGGSGNDAANSIIYHDDFLYILGSTESFGDASGDLYLVKLDVNGNLIWEKTYGSQGKDEGIRIVATNDGNYMLLGNHNEPGNTNSDILLIKINHKGEVLWQRNYGGASDDISETIIELEEGGFLITGRTQSFGEGAVNIYLIKTDVNGNEQWHKTYGGNVASGGTRLAKNTDGTYMLYGFTLSFGAGDRDLYLIKMNAFGDTIFTKTFGGAGYEESQGFIKLKDGNYLICAHSASTDPLHNMLGIVVDENGNIKWQNNYGGNAHDGGQAAMQQNNANLLLVGVSDSFSGNQDIYVVTTDKDGYILSQTTYGGAMDDMSYDAITIGKSNIIVGKTNSFGSGDYDMYVIKTKVES